MIAGFVTGKGTAWFDDVKLKDRRQEYEGRRIPALKTELKNRDRRDMRKYIHALQTCEPYGGICTI